MRDVFSKTAKYNTSICDERRRTSTKQNYWNSHAALLKHQNYKYILCSMFDLIVAFVIIVVALFFSVSLSLTLAAVGRTHGYFVVLTVVVDAATFSLLSNYVFAFACMHSKYVWFSLLLFLKTIAPIVSQRYSFFLFAPCTATLYSRVNLALNL